MRWLVFWVFSALAALAEGEPAGDFDYYVLSLSWNATWCEIEGDARGAEQCEDRFDHGWTLHGLWPQYENGWPSYCNSAERNPSRSDTAAMEDIMGSDGLAWHQWNKHGRCTGLSSDDYYALSRLAYGSVTRPDVFRRLTGDIRVPASVVEEAFLEENPDLTADMLTVTCRDGMIQEVRVCLERDLTPRECGYDVIRDCSLDDAYFPAMR